MMRPGRRNAAIDSRGCSTDVGLVGLPRITRSAVSGTSAPDNRHGSSSVTCVMGTPAARSAISGSVNDGWMSAA